jgi:hypothetical protein
VACPAASRADRRAHAETRTGPAQLSVDAEQGTSSAPEFPIDLDKAGVAPHEALPPPPERPGAYLGIAGLTDGAPADAVVFDIDPRTDLSQLDTPRAVIVRGQLVRRRR